MININTLSGKCIDPLNPKPSDIVIQDIAEPLAKQCRYNGQCKGFFSVAQHSVICSKVCEKSFAPYMLLHDAAEAYIGDIIHPVKVNIHGFNYIEERFIIAILKRFNIEINWEIDYEYTKSIDLAVRNAERKVLFDKGKWEDCDKAIDLKISIVPWSWQIAKAEFLQRMGELKIR